jgi:hypothetical protein
MDTTSVTMFQETVKYNGDYIFVKPICDFFGLDNETQVTKISESYLIQNFSKTRSDKMLFGDNRERLALTKQGFILWITQINPKTVSDTVQEKLMQYQKLVLDFLYGSYERELKIKSTILRVKKLKRLRAKINLEISQGDKLIKNYIEGRFIQPELEFKEDESSKIKKVDR